MRRPPAIGSSALSVRAICIIPSNSIQQRLVQLIGPAVPPPLHSRRSSRSRAKCASPGSRTIGAPEVGLSETAIGAARICWPAELMAAGNRPVISIDLPQQATVGPVRRNGSKGGGTTPGSAPMRACLQGSAGSDRSIAVADAARTVRFDRPAHSAPHRRSERGTLQPRLCVDADLVSRRRNNCTKSSE